MRERVVHLRRSVLREGGCDGGPGSVRLEADGGDTRFGENTRDLLAWLHLASSDAVCAKGVQRASLDCLRWTAYDRCRRRSEEVCAHPAAWADRRGLFSRRNLQTRDAVQTHLVLGAMVEAWPLCELFFGEFACALSFRRRSSFRAWRQKSSFESWRLRRSRGFLK